MAFAPGLVALSLRARSAAGTGSQSSPAKDCGEWETHRTAKTNTMTQMNRWVRFMPNFLHEYRERVTRIDAARGLIRTHQEPSSQTGEVSATVLLSKKAVNGTTVPLLYFRYCVKKSSEPAELLSPGRPKWVAWRSFPTAVMKMARLNTIAVVAAMATL